MVTGFAHSQVSRFSQRFHRLARMGEVSQIGDVVLYLQKTTFVTAENIRVNGRST
ncbi:MAG: hypothetical protein JO077_16090 [Verrucomicrobia bacterium]|nr:hypothetical protein [Verrucomicrobiota bacterium]